MEQSKPIIRLGTSKEASGICSLIQKVAPQYKRDIEFWTWINQYINGENSPIISVAEIKGEIIGHYAILPRQIKFNGELMEIGFGIHAVIDNEKTHLVSIFEVSNLAYKTAKAKGLKFIYGFPNKNFRLIQQKIERWERVSLFNALETTIENIELSDQKYCFEELTNSPKDIGKFNVVFDEQTENEYYSFSKSFNYFIQRYFKHPHNLYSIFLAKNKLGKSFVLVTKRFDDNDKIKGHLVDYVITENVDHTEIIDASLQILSETGVEVFSFWPINSSIKQILMQKGFNELGFDTFFGIKFLNKDFKNNFKDLLLDFSNWQLLMGDSDAF